MILQVIGSGSTGNSYLLESDSGEVLIMECGVSVSKIKKALGFDLQKVVGAFASHAHGDHIKCIKDVLSHGIKVYAHKHVHESQKTIKDYNAIILERAQQVKVGSFTVKAFDLEHDVPSFGFLIQHPEMGKAVFITDTAYCGYKFEGLNNIILEANYSKEIMMKRFVDGDINAMVRDRVFNSHMSLETSIEFLKANDLTKVNKIVYIHLSSGNADEKVFVEETIKHVGFRPEIAKPGKSIEINKTAF